MEKVWIKFLGSIILVCASWFCLDSQTAISESSPMKQEPSLLAQIIVNENLWAEDAPAVFAWLDSWKKIGEPSIVIHPDSVVAGVASASESEAKQRAARLDSMTRGDQPQLKPFFAEKFAGRIPSEPPFRCNFLTSQEDDSIRVAWLGKGPKILRRGVTISTVLETFGQPERKTTRLVQNKRETRPILLTFYHYFNSAVQFVESDPAPDPDLVNRIVFNVNATASELFE